MQANDQLLQLVLTSRVIDVGAILVSVTAVIITTRNSVRIISEDVKKLLQMVEKHSELILHHEIDITKIKTRCAFINRESGEGCARES